MPIHIRILQGHEGELLKTLFITMTTETPTAFAGTLAELQARTDESWQTLATDISASPNLEGFIAENADEVCGFVTAAILTLGRLALFEGASKPENADSLSDTTMLGRMWVAPSMRGQGHGQALIEAVLNWAKEHGQQRVMLAVSNGNASALRAYQRAGFVPTGHTIPHPNYPELPINMMEYTLGEKPL